MMSKPASGRRAKVNDYYASPAETEKISVLAGVSGDYGFPGLNFFQFRCHIFSNTTFDIYERLKKLTADFSEPLCQSGATLLPFLQLYTILCLSNVFMP